MEYHRASSAIRAPSAPMTDENAPALMAKRAPGAGGEHHESRTSRGRWDADEREKTGFGRTRERAGGVANAGAEREKGGRGDVFGERQGENVGGAIGGDATEGGAV